MTCCYRLSMSTKRIAQHINATTSSSVICRAVSIAPTSRVSSRHHHLLQNAVAMRNIKRYSSSEAKKSINGVETQTPQRDEGKSDGLEASVANGEEPDMEKLRSELQFKVKEVIDLKDKYLRSIADYRNLQDRTKREVQAARDYAIQRFATDLLESLDNFDRALGQVAPEKIGGTPSIAQTSNSSTSPPSQPTSPVVPSSDGVQKDLLDLHSGLQMTQRVLLQTLRRHGLAPFDPTVEAEKFDPNKHEAMFQAPQPDKEDGSVFHTQQKGYTLNGRVLRAAKVGVVKNS